MPFIHGQAIHAEELERTLSREFDARRFASLCNAIVWSSARRRCSTLPSFTERVNVKDKGIDASWDAILPDDQGYGAALLGPGWNVFQYKLRDVTARNRYAIFSGIKSSMRRALISLYSETKRRPKRYILFVNLDLQDDQTVALKKVILEGYDQPEQVSVEIVGAAELAAFLVDLPHVRLSFFEGAPFIDRETAVQRHEAEEKFTNANVELVGRNAQLNTLRSLVDSPDVKGIVVTGPQGIGKTRLALQATEHRPLEVIVADGDITGDDLRMLGMQETDVVVLVEDPDDRSANDLVKYALAAQGVKVLITLPTAADAPEPNFGQDTRMTVLPLTPLTDMESYDLLKKVGVTFDYGIESWVVEQAGGIPRILLLAAGLGPELRKTAQTFIEVIAEAYERRVRTRFGDTAVAILQRLSLLSKVGIEGTVAGEVKLICSVVSDGCSANAVLNAVPDLEYAGLVRTIGSFTEVIPPLFANRLASAALRGRFSELLVLFARLGQRGRARLIARLCLLRNDEVAQFWDELFSNNGLFPNLQSALADIHLLHQISGAVPERIAPMLYDGLHELSVEQRHAIKRTERRELMWILEQLLCRRDHTMTALRCLAQLAEAENETCGNNATGVFCEAFHASHSQMPLPLQSRLKVLRELLSEQNSTTLRVLAIKAAKQGLDNMGGYTLRQSRGPDPLDIGPEMTDADYWEYTEALVDILLEQTQSDDPDVGANAREAIPRALVECAVQTLPEHAISRFEKAIEWVITRQVALPVTELVEAIQTTQQTWQVQIAQSEPDWAARYQAGSERLQALIDRLDKADFSVRLRRWTGDWIHDDYQQSGFVNLVATQNAKLEHLAHEVIQDTSLLPDDLLEWVCSEKAKRGPHFLFWLGKLDADKTWLPKVETIASSSSAAGSFAAYCEGVASHAPTFMDERLDELAEQRTVSEDAIVLATYRLGSSPSGVGRIVRLLRENRVHPPLVARTLKGDPWIRMISAYQCFRLLEAIAGPEREYATDVVDLLGYWIDAKQPLANELAELAWECLESAENVNHKDEYDFDRLAAYLTDSDSARGFRLLENLISQPYNSHKWIPFSYSLQNNFWEMLRKHDKSRAIRTLLTCLQQNRTSRYRLSHRVQRALKQEEDRNQLIEFAIKGRDSAQAVADSISSRYPGFWPVAFAIATQYPDDEEVIGSLERSIWQVNGIISGSWSMHIQRCQEEVERILDDEATPSSVRSWLRDVHAKLAGDAERALVSESNKEVDGFSQGVEGTDTAERQWAIRTLASQFTLEQLRSMFSKEELEAAMEVPQPPNKVISSNVLE